MRPNKGFMIKLMALEKELFGVDESSVDLDVLFPKGESRITKRYDPLA